jgi:uncharacterized protein YdbL (DUF1318 family)
MRRAALLVCLMISALVVATGVALAAAEAQTEGTEGTEGTGAPLQGDESTVDFVPNEVVVRTNDGEYETRKVDAQTLDAVEKAAERIEAREPSVEETSPNFVYTIDAVSPDDPLLNRQYWLHVIKA